MDELMQKLHELQRSLDLERANKEYLSGELESIHTVHDEQRSELARKHSLEIEKFRQQVDELKNQNQSLEDDFQSQIRTLKIEIETLKCRPTVEPIASLDLSTTNYQMEQIQELSANLQESREQIARLTESSDQMRQQLEEKITCLTETLQSKREEVEERDQTLEQYQDTILELRSELMQLQAEPDATDCNKKGNSLFAEVLDQRQQVVHLLGAQNRSFKEMKRAYRQSEAEIRQLKEENSLMVREIGKIKSIFLGANKAHSAQLNKRIADLHRDLDRFKQKAQFLEEQVKDGKVAAVMEFYRNEGEQMRQELRQSRMQKCEMEDQLQAAQEELAQWRFQCLRQKCVLIDREMRLEANNIQFESRCSVPVDDTVHVSVEEDGGLVRDERQPQVVNVDEEDDMELELSGEKEKEEEEVTKQEKPKEENKEPFEAGKEEEQGNSILEDEPKQEQIEDVDCEIVGVPGERVIDLCVNSPPEAVKEDEMDMSLEMDSNREVTTRKAKTEVLDSADGQRVVEEPLNIEMEPKGVERKTTVASSGQDGFINFDFLLNSPKNKPQPKSPPQFVDLCSPDVRPTGGDNDNKENEEDEGKLPQQKKMSSMTKLNYKAINPNHGAKSILVKRTGMAENNQKNVQFAAEVQKKEEEVKEPRRGVTVGGVFVKQEPGFNFLAKKSFKVNFRTIHSKPSPVVNSENKEQ